MRLSTHSLRRTGVALVFLTTIVSAFVFAAGALASDAGNSVNAKLCQKGGWQALMDSSAQAFPNEGTCVSYGAQGGAIYALARLHVEACAQQPFDGLCVSTSGFGLEPTTFVTTPILKNGVPTTTEFLIVPVSGSVNGNPFAHFEAPCVAGNVYSATASGTSADSLSSPTMPGIDITSNTVTRTSSCP
jgi:hypothetical protein